MAISGRRNQDYYDYEDEAPTGGRVSNLPPAQAPVQFDDPSKPGFVGTVANKGASIRSVYHNIGKGDPFNIARGDIYKTPSFDPNAMMQGVNYKNYAGYDSFGPNLTQQTQGFLPGQQDWASIGTGLTGDFDNSKAKAAIDALSTRASAVGPSQQAQYLIGQQRIGQQANLEDIMKEGNLAQAQATANLARTGGLSGGARERMAERGALDVANQRQRARLGGSSERLGLMASDEANKQNILASMPGLVNQFNQGVIGKAQALQSIMQAAENAGMSRAQLLQSSAFQDMANKMGIDQRQVAEANRQADSFKNLNLEKFRQDLAESQKTGDWYAAGIGAMHRDYTNNPAAPSVASTPQQPSLNPSGGVATVPFNGGSATMVGDYTANDLQNIENQAWKPNAGTQLYF